LLHRASSVLGASHAEVIRLIPGENKMNLAAMGAFIRLSALVPSPARPGLS
jgi:hypothetical protein